jgi:hypothetical protein
MRLLACVLALATSACTLSNMTPKARFSDAAYTLNDAARWGQVDLASTYVSAEYMERFVARHRFWGASVSIADAEVVRMQLADDRKSATTVVALNWYDTHGVTLRSSVIAQKWDAVRGNFKLVDESISSGDPRIFAEADAKPAENVHDEAVPQ